MLKVMMVRACLRAKLSHAQGSGAKRGLPQGNTSLSESSMRQKTSEGKNALVSGKRVKILSVSEAAEISEGKNSLAGLSRGGPEA